MISLVRWRDHVTKFLSSLPSNAHYLPVEIILDRAGLIDGKSKKKVLFLRNDPAEAVVLLCDGAFSETIIKQVGFSVVFIYEALNTYRTLFLCFRSFHCLAMYQKELIDGFLLIQ